MYSSRFPLKGFLSRKKSPLTIMPKQWFPLESNPSVMTAYIRNIGVDTSTVQFHDVLSPEDWAIEMVPGPILGERAFPSFDF